MSHPLSARGLYRFHGTESQRVPVLEDVSFDLEEGSFTAIMGPSGSGKSTLLHLLAGLDSPSAGEVVIGGVAMSDATEAGRTALRRDSLGFVFQFFNLLPDLSVAENVALPLRIRGKRPGAHANRIDELLELLGIANLRDRVPAGLSGGELQRVSIARALVTSPPLVLADEPTGNLSSKAGEEVIQLLKQAARKTGSTLLLVTHNPRDAAEADRVLFLHDGRMDPTATLSGGPFELAQVHGRLQELGI